MLIKEILAEKKTAMSFEFFPVKSQESENRLIEKIEGLIPLKPAYVSVNYGAGGGSRTFTHDLVKRIVEKSTLEVVAHLTCIGHTTSEIADILEQYNAMGVHNIFALRGDTPKNPPPEFNSTLGFNHAAELVAFVKKRFPNMGIGVAGFPEGHPETPNRLKELEYLKAKVDAGADYICTQLFFDNRDYWDFCERCEVFGIKVPIIAGIMPISTFSGMKRMCDLALGARIPAKLLKAVLMAATGKSKEEADLAVERVGISWASEQVRGLVDGKAAGIHFYTLNQSNATREIYKNLGITNSDAITNFDKNWTGVI